MQQCIQDFEELIACSKSMEYYASKFSESKALTPDQYSWLVASRHPGSRVQLRPTFGSERGTLRTRTMLVRALWEATFKNNSSVLFMTHQMVEADRCLNIIREMVTAYPAIHYKMDRVYNSSIQFENGSKIRFSPPTTTTIRGTSFNLVLLDNTNLFKNYTEIMQALLPMMPSTQAILMESL